MEEIMNEIQKQKVASKHVIEYIVSIYCNFAASQFPEKRNKNDE